MQSYVWQRTREGVSKLHMGAGLPASTIWRPIRSGLAGLVHYEAPLQQAQIAELLLICRHHS